jgi:peroxiredoxin
MWDRFEAEGVALAAIVVDPEENNRAMVDKLFLPFPILSDTDSRVIREWDVLNEAEHDIAKPAIFGIRRSGRIGYRYVGDDYTDRPDDEELFAGLKEVVGDGER